MVCADAPLRTLTASQKCPCKQTFLLHGIIITEILATQVFGLRPWVLTHPCVP